MMLGQATSLMLPYLNQNNEYIAIEKEMEKEDCKDVEKEKKKAEIQNFKANQKFTIKSIQTHYSILFLDKLPHPFLEKEIAPPNS
jgi:hypothetical protein